jgi:hypothetical protein
MSKTQWQRSTRWLRNVLTLHRAPLAAGVLCSAALVGGGTAAEPDPATVSVEVVAYQQPAASETQDAPAPATGNDAAPKGQKEPSDKGHPSKPVTKTGHFHLGIQITTLPEAVRSHLQLQHGVLIERVLPDSPAAKAGLKPHDILLAVGQTLIHQPEDILNVLRQADGKPLALRILRQGQEHTIEVTPQPASPAGPEGWWGAFPPVPPFPPGTFGGPMPPDVKQWPEYKQLEEALERFRSKIGRDGVGLWFARPGVIIPPGKFDFFWGTSDQAPTKLQRRLRAEFADGVTIDVTRDEPQPAKIHVQRGEQSWDVTEDRLHELPKELVPRVQRLLGMGLGWRLPVAVRVRETVEKEDKQGRSDKPDKGAFPAESKGRLEPSASEIQKLLERLERANQAAQEKMEEAIRQLRKELEELRKGQVSPANP